MEFPSDRFRKNAAASTGLIFIRVYNKWHAAIKNALRKIGITHPQFVVMTVLNFLEQSEEFVSQARIAKMADMDVMSVSQIIRGLEAGGYLARTPNPKDTRANAIRLLEKGREAVRLALPLVEQIDDDFFGALLHDETAFRGFLHRLA
ncbi:MAG: MarR family transcriptional regulator [Deltaproteobacteria bacterium]|nr:MarR family transcriptional regulator [Deltaproteobacteria bacterium]